MAARRSGRSTSSSPTGECEFVGEFASPFAMLVIADLLGVPEADHEMFRDELAGERERRRRRHRARTHGAQPARVPLRPVHRRTSRIAGATPRNDVLTGLATATFPDGSTARGRSTSCAIAANLFAAGQETTVRLLAHALQLIGEQPELQQRLRDERDLIPNFVEEALRHREPGQGRLPPGPRCRRRSAASRSRPAPRVMVLNGAANRDPAAVRATRTSSSVDRANARQHIAFGHGVHTCPGAPLARAEGTRQPSSGCSTALADIRISEAVHGPPDARRYEYTPTYILRGLSALHLEFSPAG